MNSTVLGLFVFMTSLVLLRGQGTQPLVAIHDSELTRALEAMPATPPTPTGAGASGREWWPTNWHYFVMPESLKESLRSDGTAFAVVGDSEIAVGALLTNGRPRYPITFSLAAEAIRDDEIVAFTNYVAAGGFLFIGSSSFTRNTNGVARGDFAFADAMGVHGSQLGLTNWGANTVFTKQAEHRLVRHIPNGTLTWRMPAAAEEINFGISPAHPYLNSHHIWQVVATNALVLAQGNSFPYLVVKPYGKGWFIYYAPMQPLVGHGGWSPSMYAYGIFRNAIEWAFESARLSIPKLSPWPYAYDAAFIIRHDLENYQNEIANIEASAQFENLLGGKGDYYFCTGTLRVEMGNAPGVVASLRRAVTNYNASIGPHNGGLRNPNNPSLNGTDFDYWHWGPDEALDATPTNYASGKEYALISMSNSIVDVETWLAGINTGPRFWVGCYFNATREDSYDLQDQLDLKINGEQKVGPFPHWTLSTQTPGKRYPILSQPLSEGFVGSQVLIVAQSLETHTSASVRAGIDYYYGLGGLINFYSHTLSTGLGPAGSVATEYVSYGLNTNLFPRLWSANAISIYNWWLQRSNAQISVSHTSTNGNTSETGIQIAGATDPATTVELVLPAVGGIQGLEVLANGVTASASGWRTNGHALKVLVGNTVTNVIVRYTLNPSAQNDYYSVMTGTDLSVPAVGLLTNDTVGLGGTNLTAVLVSNVANGTLWFTNNGGFSYTPNASFVGSDFFSYRVFDGISNSSPATAFISVTPVGALFFDDFSRSAGSATLAPWELFSGNWSVTNGNLVGGSASQGYGYVKVDGSWADYAVQGTLRFTAGGFGGGLGGRLNPTTGAHYAAWVYPEGSAGGSSLLKLVKYLGWTSWSGTPMAQIALPGVGTNTHLLKVIFEGNRIRVFYDSIQYIDVTDTGFSGTGAYPAGGITAGLWTYLTPYSVVFDDVSVTTLAGPPLANNDSYFTPVNVPLVMPVPGVLFNDTGGGAPLSAYLVAGPTNGILNLNSNGSFTYTPVTNYIGSDAFTYRATDGLTNSAAALAAINIFSPNLPPVTSGDNYSVDAGRTLTVGAPGVLANDLDPNGNALTAMLLAPPVHGQLTLNGDGGFVYTPATNFTGTDEFTYQASDGLTNSGPASVLIAVLVEGALFTDDFARATNDLSIAPWVVQSGNWSITNELLRGASAFRDYGFVYLTNSWSNYTVSCRIQVPANAYAGGLGGCVNSTNGAHYAAWLYPGTPSTLRLIKFQSWSAWGFGGFSFVPMAQATLPTLSTNWHTLKLGFQPGRIAVYFDGGQVVSVSDPEVTTYQTGGVSLDLWTDLTPYSMQVDDVAVTPVAVNDAYPATEDGMLTVAAPGVLANDTAIYATNLLASLISSTTNGVLTLSSNGGFTYAPNTNFIGGDAFSYTPVDGSTNLGVVTVTINVHPVNDAPALSVQTNRSIPELTLLTVTNTATDTDVPAQGLSYQLLNPPVGAVINSNGVITWTPTESQGPSTNTLITVVTDNGAPARSATNSFVVTVTEVNVAPVLPAQTNRTTAELIALVVTNAATDADLPANLLTYQLLNAPPGALISGSGVIRWTPSVTWGPGTNTITTVVSDGAASATNSFAVVVNDTLAGVATNLTLISTGAVWNYLDNGSDQGIFWRVLGFNDTAWTNGPAQLGYGDGDEQTVVSFGTNSAAKYITTYFRRAFTLANPANFSSLQLRVLRDDGVVVYLNGAEIYRNNMPAGDITYQTRAASAVSGANETTFLTVAADPSPLVNGTNVIAVELHQDQPNSSDISFDLELTGVLNLLAPTLPLQFDREMAELTTLTVTNTAADTDTLAGALSYQLLNPPEGVVVDAQGVITWTPTEAQGPSINTIATTVSDGTMSVTNSFVVSVTEVNEAPVLPVQTNVTMAKLSLLMVTNTATDVDLPANNLTYQLLAPPTGMTIDVAGVINWTPTEGQGSTVNTVTTVVTDNGVPGLAATNSFTVSVLGSASAPIIQSITVSNELVTVISSAISGRSYRLQFKGSLDQTNWTDVFPAVTAVEESVVLTDAAGAVSERYYRVFLVPLP